MWWNYKKYLLKLVILRHCINPCSLATLVRRFWHCRGVRHSLLKHENFCWISKTIVLMLHSFWFATPDLLNVVKFSFEKINPCKWHPPWFCLQNFGTAKTKGSDTLLNFQIENSNNLAFIIHTCAHVHAGESINIRRAGINPRKTYCACCSR